MIYFLNRLTLTHHPWESVGAFYPYDLCIVTSAMARWVIGGIVRYNFESINPKDDIVRPYFEVD
jgi:hypothetical protein